MTDQLTQTELMVIDYEFKRTMRELSKIIPSVDPIDYRRLTYLLIETRRAAYKEARVKRTLGNLLHNRHNILHTCLVCACFWGIFSLVKINRGIVVNVDVVTGIVIPIEVEIINYIVHGKIKNSGGHKKHRQRGINSQVGKLITEIPVTHAMT